jgi:hypothetical protein
MNCSSTFGEGSKRVRDARRESVKEQNSNHKPVICVHLSNAKKNFKLRELAKTKKGGEEREGEVERGKKLFVE